MHGRLSHEDHVDVGGQHLALAVARQAAARVAAHAAPDEGRTAGQHLGQLVAASIGRGQIEPGERDPVPHARKLQRIGRRGPAYAGAEPRLMGSVGGDDLGGAPVDPRHTRGDGSAWQAGKLLREPVMPAEKRKIVEHCW